MKIDVTTREAYVIAAALYREVKRQECLPAEQQNWVDVEDMKDVLRRHLASFAGILTAIDSGAGAIPISWNLPANERR